MLKINIKWLNKRNIQVSFFLLIIILIVYLIYTVFFSFTKIGFINYPEFLFSKIQTSNPSKFIKLERVSKDRFNELEKYDFLLIFGKGIQFSEEEQLKIKRASDAGVKIFVSAISNPAYEFTNLQGENLDIITKYIENGGKYNYRSLLSYIRNQIDKKIAFGVEYQLPKEIRSNVLFFNDEKNIFDSIPLFEQYCLNRKFHRPSAERILLITSVPGPFNANPDHIFALVEAFYKRGYNVYATAGLSNRKYFIENIKPSAIIYMPHGRLGSLDEEKSIDSLLKRYRIPVFAPITVMQDFHQWMNDVMPMSGGYLSQSITVPEFDGAIVPYTIAAQFRDKEGNVLFKVIPERIDRFCNLVENYLALKKKKNANKKVAFIYYKGHGKGAAEAAGLEVFPSLYNILLQLAKEGYNVQGLPHSYEEFVKEVSERAPLLGPYAEGAKESYISKKTTTLISSKEYEQWCNTILTDHSYKEVVDKYGKAPGSYLTIVKNEIEYIAISNIKYGNIIIMPQPMPGLGSDAFRLIHGTNEAPPHSYIAPYLWLKFKEKVDAMVHMGTHGSLEFTPKKQIALSNNDWADILTTDIPHFYFYSMHDPGEAMMAKRRSYATIISHLTPPLMASQLNSAQNQFAELFKKYHETREPLKSQYAEAILKLATEKGYTKDLNLAEGVISDENMLKLINYIENLETETITSGLYTLGKPYTDHKIDETVVLMSANAIAYCRARLDKIQRKIKNEEIDNKTFFRIRYLKPAEDIVKKILTNAGVKNSIDTLSIITESEKQRYFKWLNFSKAKLRSNERFSSNQVGSYTSLEHLLIKVIVEPQKKEFISNLISERTFERTYSLLDNEKFKKAERVSRFVPEMRNTIALMKDSNLRQLIKMMRDTVVRKEVFRLVSAGLLDDKITKEKELQAKYAISVCNQPLYRQFLSYNDGDFKRMSFYQLAAFEDVVHFLEQKKGLLLEFCKKNPSENCNRLSEFFENKFSQIQKVWNEEYEQKKELEQDFASIVEQLIISANSVKYYKESLFKSPSEEIKSMFEFLSGGYISPGPGGDPITNPASIPSGKNLYAVNAELTPSKEAWKLGVKLVDKMLSDFKNKHKVYPKKVALTLWSSEFIETEGATIAQAFYLLGVEPIWDAFGRIQDLKLISHHDLKRPRIDIVVQTSGQLRDLAASRLFLIHKAIQLAANDKASPENYVNEGIRKAEAKLIKNGFSPKEAKEYAQYRVFGGVNGNYGTGIMSLVEKGDAWDSISQIAQTYINNMGAIYSEKENFGFFRAGIFEAALENTEAIIQPRQSNTWGPLSLDHVYEFMGGISSAVTKVTGKEPEAYFADYRNPFNMQIQGLKEAIWTETRTTITNPRYIKEYMKGEGTSAETFAETFRNIFGWGALKSSVIEQRLWDDLYDTYVLDKQKLGIHQFFEAKNPYALQEITAVMLEAIRKGIWKATDQQRDKILQLHTNLIKNYDAACSEFVCNNRKLISFVKTNLSKSQAFEYESKLSKELSGTSRESMVLSKKQDNNQDKKQTYNNSFNFNFLLSLFLGALVFIIAVALFFKFKK